MYSAMLNRRRLLGLMGATATLPILGRGFVSQALAADGTVTIAYNVNLPSFDPTVGASAVNPTIQALFQAIFDPYIAQEPNLKFKPGLLTDWGWNEDKTKVHMTVREGATWHNGDPVTAEDVVWSLERAANPDSGNPIQFIWSTVGNYKIDGNKITGDVLRFEPTFFMWMGFLTGYVLPKKYYESVGAEGFEAKPVGSGPYMVDEYQQNAFLRLKANPNYWGGKPAYDTVIYKFIPDSTSRVAELESGSSDVTLEIPYEEFDRLKENPDFVGYSTPISDIAMIFLNDVEPMLDKNVRLAANYAIDKQAIVDRLLRGYGVVIDTLEAPEYSAFDAAIKIPYDPAKASELLAASGFSPENPVKFKIQTTRGFKPKDYEMIQAIVGMWRKVGIEAEIEVYEIAKHYELRAGDQLAPAAFYNWGNSIGDPTTSTGFAMFGPSPHSVWDGQDLIDMIGPLWGEADEQKRIEGWKKVDRFIAEEGLVIPLLQYVQPIIARKDVKVIPEANGMLKAQNLSPG